MSLSCRSLRQALRGACFTAGVLAAGLAWAAPEAQSGFSGLWKPVRYITALQTIDGRAPPLLPLVRAVYSRHRAEFAQGNSSFNHEHPCLDLGQPRMNFVPYPIEIIDSAQQFVMLYVWGGYRLIRMSGQPPQVVYPLIDGYSTGRREGRDVVITTAGIAAKTFLDAAGMPHSVDLEISERLHLLDHGHLLRDVMTFDDPKTFTHPWSTVVTWKRIPGEWRENVCLERVMAGKPAIDPEH